MKNKPQNNHPVPCTNGGEVMLDSPLFQLWELAQTHPLEQAVALWCEMMPESKSVAQIALEVLARAGLLANTPPVSSVEPQHLDASHKINTEEHTNATDAPLVSVIIVNRDGQAHLSICLPSLASQNYPNLEIIVVDNGSQDESITWLNNTWPNVKVIALKKDIGFAGANNRGMAEAKGDYFFLLNNDTRLEPNTITLLVNRLTGEERVGAVVPQIRLMAQPAFVNALGNSFGPHGWGSDSYIGHLDVGQLLTVRQVPSACFAAVLIPRAAYEQVGKMDEAYGYYYEDSDWSWRVRLQGFQILAEANALVYHAFGGTSASRSWPYKLKLVARNRLRFVLKNLDKHHLRRFILNYLREDIGAWRHARKNNKPDIAQAYSTAWRELIKMVPDIRQHRRQIQTGRLVSDAKILREMEQIPTPRMAAGKPFLSLSHILQNYGPSILERDTMTLFDTTDIIPRRHLVIIHFDTDKIKTKALDTRYQLLSQALTHHLNITLVVARDTERKWQDDAYNLETYTSDTPDMLRPLLEKADIILGNIASLHQIPFLESLNTPIIIDLAVSFLLDSLETHQPEAMHTRDKIHQTNLDILKKHIHQGDFFICANEQQRDLWLGVLLAYNRVNPINYSRDKTLRCLIDVVSFDTSNQASQSVESVEKSKRPTTPDDETISALLNFCLQPHLATDRAAQLTLPTPKAMTAPPPTAISQLPAKAVRMLLEKGPISLLGEISRYLLWRLIR